MSPCQGSLGRARASSWREEEEVRGQKLESKGLFAATLSAREVDDAPLLSSSSAVCYQACVKRARVCVCVCARATRGRLTIPDILVALRMR